MYRVICFDSKSKQKKLMGIGVNFRTVIKSTEEELSENKAIES